MTLETSLAIEQTWAARLVTEPHRNTERLAEWEALKDIWRLWPSKPLRSKGGTGNYSIVCGPVTLNVGAPGGGGTIGNIHRIYP